MAGVQSGGNAEQDIPAVIERARHLIGHVRETEEGLPADEHAVHRVRDDRAKRGIKQRARLEFHVRVEDLHGEQRGADR
jgi:hypothetical protein